MATLALAFPLPLALAFGRGSASTPLSSVLGKSVAYASLIRGGRRSNDRADGKYAPEAPDDLAYWKEEKYAIKIAFASISDATIRLVGCHTRISTS